MGRGFDRGLDRRLYLVARVIKFPVLPEGVRASACGATLLELPELRLRFFSKGSAVG